MNSEKKKENLAEPVRKIEEQDDSRKLGPEEPNFQKKKNWILKY